jgi:hypothetical protein
MKILPIAIASLGLLSAQPGFEVVSVKPTPEERLKESRASKVFAKMAGSFLPVFPFEGLGIRIRYRCEIGGAC